MSLFIPVQTKRFKRIITCCSVPTFDKLLPGFRDVRMSLHGWQYNAPSGACFGHMKLRDWFCDSWNFFKKPNFLVVDSAVGKSLFLDRLALVVSGKTRHPFFQPWSKHSKKKDIFLSFQVQKGNKNKSISRIFALVIQKIKYLASRISLPFQTPPRSDAKPGSGNGNVCKIKLSAATTIRMLK